MSIFLSYILLGISLSAPMGPINAAQIDKGIRFGFMHAWLLGVGAMLADALFMLLIYFGLSQWIDTPLIKSFLWSFGFFILCYTGFESMIHSSRVLETPHERNVQEKRSKSMFTGFFLAISNPLSIIFWLGIYGAMLAQTSKSYAGEQLLLYSGGIFIGILVWDVCMASLASGARRWIQPRMLQVISIVSGIVLVVFGLYFGFQAFQLLFA